LIAPDSAGTSTGSSSRPVDASESAGPSNRPISVSNRNTAIDNLTANPTAAKNWSRKVGVLKPTIDDLNLLDVISSRKSLLVGEGDLSFSLNLTSRADVDKSQVLISTFEGEGDILSNAVSAANKAELKNAGFSVMHSVDATQLGKSISNSQYDFISFVQLHKGGKRGSKGFIRNNTDLIKGFMSSASQHLNQGGHVAITVSNSRLYTAT
jgi:hypothetical protein